MKLSVKIVRDNGFLVAPKRLLFTNATVPKSQKISISGLKGVEFRILEAESNICEIEYIQTEKNTDEVVFTAVVRDGVKAGQGSIKIRIAILDKVSKINIPVVVGARDIRDISDDISRLGIKIGD